MLRLYDKSFNLIGEETLDPLAPGHQRPRFIHEFLQDAALSEPARDMEGALTLSSDIPLAAVTLRQNDDPSKEFPQEVPTLTTMPVVPGRADSSPELQSLGRSPFHRQGCLCHSPAGSLFFRGWKLASLSPEPSVTQASLPVIRSAAW
ncbi:MAG: hypothetical protein V3T83_12665 [Acidobacteriota bacterium]